MLSLLGDIAIRAKVLIASGCALLKTAWVREDKRLSQGLPRPRFNPSISRGWSLRSLLLLLVLVGILPVFALGLTVQYLSYREERGNAGRLAQEITRSMAVAVGRELHADIAGLELLALSPTLQTGDIAGLRERAVAFVAHFAPGANVLLLTQDGEQVMNTAVPPGTPLHTRLDQENMREVFRTGLPRVSDLYRANVTNRPITAIEVPVKRADGSVAYSLALHSPVDDFAENINRQRLRKGWVVALSDRQGVVIARTLNPERFVGQKIAPEVIASMLSEPEGTLDATSLEGISMLSAYSRVEPYGWSVAIGMPRVAYTAPASRWLLLTFGLDGSVLLLTFLLAAVVAGRITGPMATLQRLAAADDEINGLRPTGLREANELAQVLIRDITERKRAMVEQKATQAQLAQAQKMEAIGQLTGGIAHDFNNLLTAVIGNLDLISHSAPENERILRFAAGALQAAERGAELTSHLLAFGRRQVLRPENINVLQALANIEPLLKRALGATIRIEVRVDADLMACHADGAQFESAILNLALNARGAMPKGGLLTITAINMRIGPEDAAKLDIAPGEYVRATVADTGTGMSPTILEQAFEPFFTTKGIGEGSGLGLSQVYGFAKQSSGTCAIESKLDEGTSVSLFLPAARIELLDDEEKGQPPEVAITSIFGKTILIVEDQADVRDVAEAFLKEVGYGTLVRRDATQAIAILESSISIDLLFSDIVLPGGMSGIELARIARRLRPELKVLLTSGYPGNEWTKHDGLDDVSFLAKPYRNRQLADRVRDLLNRAT